LFTRYSNTQIDSEGMTSTGKTLIGIDPGLHGAISIIKPDLSLDLMAMPLVLKKELDVKRILDIIYIQVNPYVIIEDVHSVHNASAKANFEFGFGCGSLFAILKIIEVPFSRIAPKTWQKEMWQGVKPIMVLDKGKDKEGKPKYKVDTKATSLLAVKRIFPHANLLATNKCSVPHNGIVDALLMAEFGRRKNF